MNPSYYEDSAASAVSAKTKAGTSALGTTALGSGAVHPGRAELEAFIASTRRELQALSQTLSQALTENAAPTPQPAPAAPPTVLADTPHEATADPVSTHDAVCPLPAETVGPECHTPPSTGAPSANTPDPVSDADPMSRLNAIKLRLAQQIQNAS